MFRHVILFIFLFLHVNHSYGDIFFGKKFTPLDITNCATWFDAQDTNTMYDSTEGGNISSNNGIVARWEDKSGSNNHATNGVVAGCAKRSDGSLNGKTSLYWTGDNYSWEKSTVSSASTVFFVMDSKATQYYSVLGIYITRYFWMAAIGQTTGIGTGYRSDGKDQNWATRGDVYLANTNAPHVSVGLNVNFSTWANMDLFSYHPSYSLNPGNFGELIIYDRALTLTEIKKVEVYLSEKWGIPLLNKAVPEVTKDNQGSLQLSNAVYENLSTNGLLLHYKMDENNWDGTAGEVIDSSGNGNNGTSYGGMFTNPGKINRAGNFDGKLTRVISDLQVSSEFSLCCWANLREENTGTVVPVIGVNDYQPAFSLSNQHDGNLGFYWGDWYSFGSPVSRDKWHFVVMIRDVDKNVFAYLDGQICPNQFNIVYSLPLGVVIGQSGITYYGDPFNGMIDDVRIYNRALSSSEISQIYNAELKSKIPIAAYVGNKLVYNPLKKNFRKNSDSVDYSHDMDFVYTVSGNEATITGYRGLGGQVNFPPTLGGYPVTTIGFRVFGDPPASVTGMIFPDSVDTLSYGSFQGLTTLSGILAIPKNVTDIPPYSFQSVGCTSVIVHEGITSIGDESLSFTAINQPVYLPSTITSVGSYVFFSTSVPRIYISALVAPTIIGTSFGGISATLYYRAEATGYTNPFGGIPTAVWTSYPNPMP